MSSISDEQILTAYDQGDHDAALRLLMESYQVRLYQHIRGMLANHDDADDVLQNTFIRAWKGLDNFKRESALYTWLYRIATNQAITLINSNKNRQLTSLEDIEYTLGQAFDTDGFTGNEIERKLQMAIQTLPAKQRAVFNMKYFDEKKYDEIAEIMDTSVGALKASYHHAVKKIEFFLTGH